MRFKNLLKLLTVFTLLILINSDIAFASSNWWKDANQNLSISTLNIERRMPSIYRSVNIDVNVINQKLFEVANNSSNKSANANEIVLPMPNGLTERFVIRETPVMEAALANKYPHIKTFTGTSLDQAGSVVKIDIGDFGFNAMVVSPQGRYFIDPINNFTKENYIVYYSKDLQADNSFSCMTEDSPESISLREQRLAQLSSNKSAAAVQLRTYRLALACTGEYAVAATSSSSPTKSQVLSKMVTSVNRVNSVYELDVAVTMVLVANNDTLIFLLGGSDPYNNNDGATMLGQNQTTVTARIGSANYDIGHVFSTGGGGIAGLGVVCSNANKARGVTGSPNPVGDAFDIDYVAHEVGHQFDATHTFNSQTGSCGGGNRSAGTAYEPGSGTTIMAYAGICGADDIRPNSDPFFHTASIDQINAFINSHTCPVETQTNNNPPVVEAGPNYTIPISTPFILNGSATDPDSNTTLTYSWEQMDLGPAGAPGSTLGNSPLFRFYPPVNNAQRIFPKLNDILSGAAVKGERLPNYTRNMNFRLTVRDNQAMAGATGYDQMSISVTSAAGPFNVAMFNTIDTIIAGSKETILWNVANTNVSPINCTHVRISLSLDNGLTFPIILADSTLNDGNELVDIPNQTSNTARIKVEALGNIFFDINNAQIRILNASGADFSVNAIPQVNKAICSPDSAMYTISINPIAGFTGNVNLSTGVLPAGATARFTKNPISLNDTAILIVNLGSVTAGLKTFNLNANDGIKYKSTPLTFTASTPLTALSGISVPNNGQINVTPFIAITWSAVTGASAYQLELSTDTNFTTIYVDTLIKGATSFVVPGGILQYTKIFARVAASNDCGIAAFSPIIRFTTSGLPAAPSNLQVVSVSSVGATIRWTDNATNETAYKVERSDNNNTTYNIVGNLGASATQYTSTNLVSGNTYYFRVKCQNALGFSNVSNEIEIPFFVGIENELNLNVLSIYPNPANDQLNIYIEDEYTGKTELTLMNEIGMVVWSKYFDKTDLNYQTEINMSDFSNGVYFLRINSDQKSITKKVMRLK
jgi:hypothetical protein